MKIPTQLRIWFKCRRCRRFRVDYCVLDDLEPCKFIKKQKDKKWAK